MKDKIYKARAEMQLAKKQLETAEQKLSELILLRADLIIAQEFVQSVALNVQNEIKYSIENIVNIFLDAMFPNEYTFKVLYEVSRNKTTARLVLVNSFGRELDPLENGGGLADVISIALRISLLLITNKERVLLFDEPGKYISEDKKDLFYEIFQKLTKDLGIQMIIVTHDEKCIAIADNPVKIVKRNEISMVV